MTGFCTATASFARLIAWAFIIFKQLNDVFLSPCVRAVSRSRHDERPVGWVDDGACAFFAHAARSLKQ